jgi:hypothetical protein
VLPTQVIEELGARDGEIPHAALEEVSGEHGFRGDNELGRLRPAADFPEDCPDPAKVLLVCPLVGPHLGYGKAEHIIKVTIPLTFIP